MIPEAPAEEPPMEEMPAEAPPVERPEGFEERERVATDWKPRDVVYQASQDIGNAETLFVCWVDNGEIRFHSSGENVAALIVGALGAYMGWK